LNLHRLRLATVPALLAFALAGMAPAHADVARARVTLLGQVAVRHGSVVLADVADIEGDEALVPRLRTLALGRVTPGGEPVTMDRDALARWISACLGLRPGTVAIDGARRAQIHMATANVAGTRIARVAEDALREALAASGLRVQVALLQAPADLDVPPGRLELRVRPLPAAQWADDVRNGRPARGVLPRHQSVWVDAWVDDAFVRTVPVALDVEAWGPALVSVRALPAGRPVDASAAGGESFRVETIDWADRRSLPVPVRNGVSAPEGQVLQLRRPLAAGQPLQDADVAREPLVVRGQPATLRAVAGAIELESEVEVLEDGVNGQRVRVRRADTNTVLVAQVTGRRQVELRQ